MIPGILLVKCYIDHRPLVVKPFATSGVTQAFVVLCQGLTTLGSDAKKSQHPPSALTTKTRLLGQSRCTCPYPLHR